MKSAIFLAVLLSVGAGSPSAQTPPRRTLSARIPVYVSHVGADRAGAQFVAAVKRALSRSEKYELAVSGDAKGFRLYVEVLTLEAAPMKNAVGNPSVASVVIEQMGLPNSYPVASMWYHKEFLLEPGQSEEMAHEFIADVDAHWCNHIKSSVGGCPKETLFPTNR